MSEEQFLECIKKMQSGDRSGLREIYDAYLSYIYRIILGVVTNPEDAKDLTSEFFIKLYTNAASFKEGNGHKAYLKTIAHNMAIDFLRKSRHEVLESMSVSEDEETVSYEPIGADNVEEEVISNYSIKEALSTLKEKERIIIDMKVLSEMTFEEIAATLKIPLGTVTWRYREAIKKLRRCGYYDEV